MKLTKSEQRRYDFHIPLIKREIKEGRHWLATLGTYGWTLVSEIEKLKEWSKENDNELYQMIKE